MAPQGNYFAALDGIIVDMSGLNQRLDKKANPSSPATQQNKQQQKQQPPQQVAAKKEQTKKKVVKKQQPMPDPEMMRAKPLILPEEFLQRQLVLRKLPPKPQGELQPANGGANGNNGNNKSLGAAENSEKEPKKLTLEEYEKEVLEKRKKAMEATKKSTEQRMVSLDNDFESMKLVNKKQEDNKDNKVEKEKDKDKKGKKKDSSRKSMCIDEFLKPVYGERPFTVVHGRTKFVKKQQGEGSGEKKNLGFEDPRQFPALM